MMPLMVARHPLEPLDADEIRVASAILLDTASGETEEVIVSLTEGRVASSRRRRDVQPPIVYGELRPAEQAAREHPGWQAAMRRRGITDFSLCMLNLWPAGNFGTDKPGQRLSRALTWVRALALVRTKRDAGGPTLTFNRAEGWWAG